MEFSFQLKPFKGITDDISFDEFGYNNNTNYDISTLELTSNRSLAEVVQTTWRPGKILNHTDYLNSIFKNKVLVVGVKQVSLS